MKNKSLTQKISLLVLSLLCTGCLLGKTITRDLKNEADLSSGLMAWYPFNGNAVDISGNGNHGTIHGTVPAKDRNGNEGGALYFDGNSKIVVPHSDSLNPENQLTISCGLNMTNTQMFGLPFYTRAVPSNLFVKIENIVFG
jgi:hypothetical protein